MVESLLARAQRGREVDIGLKAAAVLNGCVTGADDPLGLAPGGEPGNFLGKEGIEAFYCPIIESYQTQAAAIWIEIRGQIMQAGQSLEILRCKADILNLGSNQHPVRKR